jgi:hypothetical protein
MAIVHALSILTVALGQASGTGIRTDVRVPPPEVAAPGAEPPARPPLVLADPRLVPVEPPAPALVPFGAPSLRLDRTSRCFERPGGGRFRAQCDATTKTCLVAPDAELSDDGEPRTELDRAPACALPGWREVDFAAQGYQVLPALAEAPPGWRRDERQRVMQVNFDLARRIWLGAGWGTGSFPWSDQGEANAGVRWDIPLRIAAAPGLLRLRALETYVAFDGTAADFTVLGADASRAYPSPLVRLSSFVGRPRRFDPPLYVGAWAEAVRLESLRPTPGRWYDRLSIGALALTLDLWRSRDLGSFVRLRGGAGYETVDRLEGGAFTPQAAADLDLTLDRDGFHHARATFLAEWIRPAASGDLQPEDPSLPRLPSDRRRLTARAEYEWIFLAVNDQPLSLVLDGRAQSRDDVPDLSDAWHWQVTASVRFNLWAPPRRDAALQERL